MIIPCIDISQVTHSEFKTVELQSLGKVALIPAILVNLKFRFTRYVCVLTRVKAGERNSYPFYLCYSYFYYLQNLDLTVPTVDVWPKTPTHRRPLR